MFSLAAGGLAVPFSALLTRAEATLCSDSKWCSAHLCDRGKVQAISMASQPLRDRALSLSVDVAYVNSAKCSVLVAKCTCRPSQTISNIPHTLTNSSCKVAMTPKKGPTFLLISVAVNYQSCHAPVVCTSSKGLRMQVHVHRRGADARLSIATGSDHLQRSMEPRSQGPRPADARAVSLEL